MLYNLIDSFGKYFTYLTYMCVHACLCVFVCSIRTTDASWDSIDLVDLAVKMVFQRILYFVISQPN